MTNDERKWQRALFDEFWAEWHDTFCGVPMADARSLYMRGYADGQACCKADGVGEPSEPPTDLIYVACPYSHNDPAVRAERFERANYYSARMMAAGLLVFSPISHTHPIALAGDLPKGWDFWERYDRAYLGICRALVVLCLRGWEQSKGVQEEIKIMDDLKRPVLYIQDYNNDCLEQTIAALAKREERTNDANG